MVLDLAAAEVRLNQIDSELEQLGKQLKTMRERKRKRDAMDACPRHKRLSSGLGLKLVFILIFSSHNYQVPVWYLRGHGRAFRHKQTESELGEFQFCVEQLVLDMDVDTLVALEMSPHQFLSAACLVRTWCLLGAHLVLA